MSVFRERSTALFSTTTVCPCDCCGMGVASVVEGGAVARIGLGETTPNPLCGEGVGAV